MSGQDRRANAASTGLNHNIRYKERVFHVQTELGGPQQRDIYSNVFLGGNIIASLKSSFSGGADQGTGGQVTSSLQSQHKAIVQALLAGRHDEAIARLAAGAVYAPGSLAEGGSDDVRAPSVDAGEPPRLSAQPPAAPAEAKAATATTRPAAPSPSSATLLPVRTETQKPRLAHEATDEIIVRHLMTALDD